MFAAFSIMLGGCAGGGHTDVTPEPVAQQDNPFFQEWDTPFGVPPFDQIEIHHFEPAIILGMAENLGEIAAIIDNPKPASFTNTIEAMDQAGAALRKSSTVFFSLNGTNTNEEMQAIARRLSPLMSQHRDAISLNPDLFKRVAAVHAQREDLNLNTEQAKLLEETYKGFVRSGANLEGEAKEKLKAINQELAMLTLTFGENVLKETNKFELVIDNEADLAGLTDGQIAAAAEAATGRGHEGKWAFTLHKPSLIPFLQYSEKRDLREIMYKGYINVGNNGDDLDNNAILAKIAALRVTRANLLGFPSHAHYVLDDNMAKDPANVYNLLQEVWEPAIARAQVEVDEMQAMVEAEAQADGTEAFRIAGWDWWYYAEKVKLAKYDLDESMLRPYFELDKVRTGMFEVAGRLFGLEFTERPDVPVYDPAVRAFEVTGEDGQHVALLMVDYFPRASKRGGAWMNAFRKEYRKDGKRIAPVIYNVGNFTRPTADTPALLSADEVGTMFHEFGHALHGMLSQCTYRSLSGTSVARDFVELPSQIMENWAFEPEVLALYARHYQTGELIPAELVEKLKKSAHFNQGFTTVEYVAASFLDMDYHTLEVAEEVDPAAFEAASMDRIGLIPEIVSRYRSPYFRHVFAGGYSAGYYSYMWAEVLDADAFEAFKETGDIFDRKTADAFRINILEAGGSEDPMTLYLKFRGKEPGTGPLLKRRGLS